MKQRPDVALRLLRDLCVYDMLLVGMDCIPEKGNRHTKLYSAFIRPRALTLVRPANTGLSIYHVNCHLPASGRFALRRSCIRHSHCDVEFDMRHRAFAFTQYARSLRNQYPLATQVTCNRFTAPHVRAQRAEFGQSLPLRFSCLGGGRLDPLHDVDQTCFDKFSKCQPFHKSDLTISSI